MRAVISIIVIFIVCLTKVNTVCSQNCLDTMKKRCNSGECIDSDAFCDGTKDCQDGSDETGEHCILNKCPGFSFRCTYGACVSLNAKCNGKIDCADRSDENPYLCNYTVSNRIVEKNTFRCDNGQRISSDDTCDGKKDCADGSDETTEYCTIVDCPEWTYRCAYGGCISRLLVCNNIDDCADGSDEYDTICNRTSTTTPKIPITTTPTTTTTQSTIIKPPPKDDIKPSENYCEVPKIPNLLTVFQTDVFEEVITPSSYVQTFTGINYRCEKGHLLEGTLSNHCIDGNWTNSHPSCIKYCPGEHLKGVTFAATCEYRNVGISCNQHLRSGTIAKISCQVGYEKPDRIVPEILRCDDSGEWDYSPFRCEPICGTEKVESTPFIVGGDVVNITTVPWHAGIYSTAKGRYEQICGGTIISARLVISAAHCFWDDRQQKIVNQSFIAVAVGKYYRDFYQKEPLSAQYFNVSEIHVPVGYKDTLQAYQDDIAILILIGHIRYRSYIKPICLQWLDYSRKYIGTGVRGRIAGWGSTGENLVPSEELRMLEISTLSYNDCLEKLEGPFRTKLAGDKFCIASQEGETSCTGDSGGGFVTGKMIKGVQTYFLWGIISNGLTDKNTCLGGNFFTALTNIQLHSDMIINYETKYRLK